MNEWMNKQFTQCSPSPDMTLPAVMPVYTFRQEVTRLKVSALSIKKQVSAWKRWRMRDESASERAFVHNMTSASVLCAVCNFFPFTLIMKLFGLRCVFWKWKDDTHLPASQLSSLTNFKLQFSEERWMNENWSRKRRGESNVFMPWIDFKGSHRDVLPFKRRFCPLMCPFKREPTTANKSQPHLDKLHSKIAKR